VVGDRVRDAVWILVDNPVGRVVDRQEPAVRTAVDAPAGQPLFEELVAGTPDHERRDRHA
jgi:hypothetical protein